MPSFINASKEQKSQWCAKGNENVRARQVAVDPEKIKFGVEIECLIPYNWLNDNDVEVGQRHEPEEITCGDFPLRNWNIEEDGSVRTDSGRLRPVEITSPVLKGTQGVNDVVKVMKFLNRIDADVNNTCGFHVHVNMPSILGAGASAELLSSWVNRLVALTSVLEYGLVLITGNPSRHNNHFCESIKGPWQNMDSRKSSREARSYSYAASRYRTVNFENMFSRRMPTVEFRVFGGTLNYKKIVSYIHAALAIAHRSAAIGRATKFDSTRISNLYRPESGILSEVSKLNKMLKGYGFSKAAMKEWRKEIEKNRIWNSKKFVLNDSVQATAQGEHDAIPF